MGHGTRDAESRISGVIHQARTLCGSGRHEEAERLLAELEPPFAATPEVLHERALIALHRNRPESALKLLRQAVTGESIPAQYFSNLCELERRAGNSGAAVRAGRQAVKRAPNSPGALNNLAIALQEDGKPEAALEYLDEVLRLEPGNAMAHSNRGNTLQRLERSGEAVAAHREALRLEPGFARGWSNLAMALNSIGEHAQAENACRHALKLDPDTVEPYINLAASLKEQGRLGEATTTVDRALKIAPKHAPAHSMAANILREQGCLNEALDHARHAVALSRNTEALTTFGNMLQSVGRPEEAEQQYREALKRAPHSASLHNSLGHALLDQGRTDQARDLFRSALALGDDASTAMLNLGYAHRFTPHDPEPARMQALLEELPEDTAQAREQRMRLHFALAKARRDCGDHVAAFEHYRKGADLKRARLDYNADEQDRRFDQVIQACSGKQLARLRGHGHRADSPIFILGMPRSGTSLVEQILASHQQVHGAGELPDLSLIANNRVRDGKGAPIPWPEYLASLAPENLAELGQRYVERVAARLPESRHFTDKMPANFFFLGLIHLILPHARVIHCKRDPRDTCLSCYTTLFSGMQDFSYDLGELGRFYRGYERLMAHWGRVLPEGAFITIEYEHLVEDLEGETRRMLEYCDLPWDPACLSFHENRRAVRTASISQVRQPLYRSSIGRWKEYESFLQPLLESLEL